MQRTELKSAISTLLGDVTEQCFHHLIHHPQQTMELNEIIRDCAKETNYLLLKVDAHGHPANSEGALAHYKIVSRDLHKKSLHLMSRLQNVKRVKSNVDRGAGE